MVGGDSEFGKQFDSLADVVSFGVAPAMLAFVWGLHGLSENDPLARNVLFMGWIVTLGFVLCCAWRLARSSRAPPPPVGRRGSPPTARTWPANPAPGRRPSYVYGSAG